MNLFTPLAHASDEELVLLIQDGIDIEKAWTELSKRHYLKLLTRCKEWLRNDPDAEDLVHELFLQILLKIHSFHHLSKFSTWVYAVAYNKCIDFLRKNKKHLFVELSQHLETELIDEIDLDVEQFNPEVLEQILTQLSPLEKELITARFYLQQPIKKIASHYQFKESKVKMILLRARKKIKKELEKAN